MRPAAALAAALGLSVALAGCSSAPADPASADSPQQTQSALVALLDEAQQTAGGTWDVQDSPSPDPCELPGSGDEGVTFTGQRTLDAGLDEDALLAVADLLESEGFEVGRAAVGRSENVRGVMPGNQAFFVLLESGDTVATLSGQAACVPGDAYDELQKLRNNGE